ncbi:MAG TPA: hypothetical protein VH307_05590 [Streptosporangiaceae bacterium]|nr:hypothetical protein [Streptosporangiaceae bacterium]
MRVRRGDGSRGWLEWTVALAVLLLGGLIVLFTLAVLARCQGPVCPNCSQPASPPAAASPAAVTIPAGRPAAGSPGRGEPVRPGLQPAPDDPGGAVESYIASLMR